jgi:hypothetical protein
LPKVVPSQVVALIDQTFPAAKNAHNFPAYSASAGTLSAIVTLTNEIPEELITISGEDYSDLIHGLASLTQAVTKWNQRGGDEPPTLIAGGKSPLFMVRAMLAKCPDQNPSPATAALAFITDADLRDSIRTDLSTATGALHNGEWKASTVLAGAAIEALLLWAIQRDPKKLAGVVQKPNGAPEDWGLAGLIDVASALALIEANTATQAHLAKNFRNLIHPGRAQRTNEVCDRATALTALAAAELVVRDLS